MASHLLHWLRGHPPHLSYGTVGVTFDRRRLDEADRFPEPVGVQTPVDVTDKGVKKSFN